MKNVNDDDNGSGMENRPSALDDLVREAKQDLAPKIDEAAFAAMEDRILARMARMGEERSQLIDDVNARHATAATGGLGAEGNKRARVIRIRQIGAVVLAAAAAFALITKKDPGAALLERGTAQMEAAPGAGSIREAVGAGEIRVDGVAVAAGHELRAGDLVEAEGTRAVLERPRKVTWLLERAAPEEAVVVARARVKAAGESLVLALEDGAIEAQVTPVPSGEAFAVDVASGTSLVRVAVHGTHLRVARSGSHVVIDLSEGVVSIGFPPRTGSTYGTLVTAPSHVEFDATNLDATMRIDHAPAAVRAPIALVPHESATSPAGLGAVARTEAPPSPADLPGAPVAVAAAAPATVPRPLALHAVDPSHPSSVDVRDPRRGGVEGARPAVGQREMIAAAVRDCAASRSRPENVRITVASSLKLKVTPDGSVDVAQFDPPLLPEIQTCAATAIYKAKLEDAAGTSITIPIAFTY